MKIKKHLKNKEMNYKEHFFFALKYGFLMIKSGICLIIHGILPSVYKDSGEKLFSKLSKEFKNCNLKEDLKKIKNIIE